MDNVKEQKRAEALRRNLLRRKAQKKEQVELDKPASKDVEKQSAEQ